MTNEQAHSLLGILTRGPGITEFHHGGEPGADVEAHNMVREERPDIKVVGHYAGGYAKMNDPQPDPCHCSPFPDPRDRHLLSKIDVLIAVPASFKPGVSGKVWYAVELARKAEQTIITIWPNGVRDQEN
jgi:hypothetical protein